MHIYIFFEVEVNQDDQLCLLYLGVIMIAHARWKLLNKGLNNENNKCFLKTN
jgi:hypothetical protein